MFHVTLTNDVVLHTPEWAMRQLSLKLGAAFRVDAAGNLYREREHDVASVYAQ